MYRRFSTFIGTVLLTAGFGTTAFAGNVSPTPTPTPQASPAPQYTSGNFFKDLARDQKAIWTAPFHVKSRDLKWIIPLGGTTAALLATDRRTSDAVPATGNWPKYSRWVSNAGNGYATGGLSVGLYLVGKAIKNDKLRDTGRMATEALINATVVTQVFKYSFGRLRPNQDSGRGRFFQGGRSFFSGHSSSTFAVATVIACQYRKNPWIKYGAYGAASAIAISRYTGRNHFLSDILVGAAVGYEIGNYVCKNRQTAPSSSVDPNHFSWKPSVEPWASRMGVGGQLVWYF